MSAATSAVLELEREVELGGLGSLGVKDRSAWRESLEERCFHPQRELLEAEGQEEPVWRPGLTTAGVAGLRLALLQVARSLELRSLGPPLVEEEEGERKATDVFKAWQAGLVEATSPSQVLLHLAIAQSAILSRRSKLSVRCRECRRKGELMPSQAAVDLVRCQRCDRCFHLACVTPRPLAELPSSPWLCRECKKKSAKASPTAAASKAKEATTTPATTKTTPTATKNGSIQRRSPKTASGTDSDSSESPRLNGAAAAAALTTKTGRVIRRKRAFDEGHSPSPASAASANGAGSPAPPEERAAAKKRPKPAPRRSEETAKGGRGGLSPGDAKLAQAILEEAKTRDEAWPFAEPVDAKAVPLYYQVIAHPMDLGTMSSKLRRREYSSPAGLVADAALIFANCRAFNEEGCEVARAGGRLEKWLMRRLRRDGFPVPDANKKRASN